MMDEICEATTPTGYHSSDMVTVDNGADGRGRKAGVRFACLVVFLFDFC